MVKTKQGLLLVQWQIKAKEGGVCTKCKTIVPKLTVDHIIPINIIDMLDRTGVAKFMDEENFEYLCYPCNLFKGGKIDITHPKTKELLIKLLKNI